MFVEELYAAVCLFVEICVALLAQDGLAHSRERVHCLNLEYALVTVECEHRENVRILCELDTWNVALFGDIHVELACHAALDVE